MCSTVSKRSGYGLVFTVLAVFAALALHLPGAAVAANPTGVQVSVGYADTFHSTPPSAGTFPTPWLGTTNTIFIGQGCPNPPSIGNPQPCQLPNAGGAGTHSCFGFDAGAILLQNYTPLPVLVSSVVVAIPGATGFVSPPWGSFTIPAAQGAVPGQAILTQTVCGPTPADENFDTSDALFGAVCNPAQSSTIPPTVTVTAAGATTMLKDTSLVFTTGGNDKNACAPFPNESHAWSPIGPIPVPLLPATGAFVIGNLDAAIGTNVTWWGAQWWKDNSLSGGSAPAAFKGFADFANPPAAGASGCGTWSTRPGNSSKPPDSVPQYMAVIVSSSISQSGSTISGDIQHVVVVQTNAGYAANPGHAGTGTVVAVLC